MLHYKYCLMLAAMVVASCGLCMDLRADHNVKVSPSDELLIIDPNQDSQNRPTPNFVADGNGNQRIEIPPTVIFHRYYYTGDRDFQGPMLPGGVTVLVANHPRTGEQVSVQAMLLPGAPRIRYCKTSIIYNYSDRCITLDFGHLCGCEPKMIYHRDDPLSLGIQQKVTEVHGVTRGFVVATGIPQAASEIRTRGHNAIQATGQRINTTGTAVFGHALNLFDSTPAGDLGKPSTRQNAANFLQTERTGITKELEDTIGTNR